MESPIIEGLAEKKKEGRDVGNVHAIATLSFCLISIHWWHHQRERENFYIEREEKRKERVGDEFSNED